MPLLGLGMVFAALAPHPAAAQNASSGDFHYHAQPRDTLIGLGRRLLLEPGRWHELQRRNQIIDPRRIPSGAIIQIPYEWLRTASESASVATVTGSVHRTQGAVTPGDVLPEGSVLETGSDGSVTIDLADGSVVTLQKSSSLQLDQMAKVSGVDGAHSIRLKLDSGRVETAVKPHRDVGRFEIVTPVAVSAVRGTEFRTGYSEDAHATTETLQGVVNVAGDSAGVPVAAGFGTRVERGQPPLAPVVLLPPPDLTQLPATNGSRALRVEFSAVPGAHSYRVQLATDEQFHAIVADATTAGHSADIAGLADGEYWLRARSIDALGLEGKDAVRRVTQHVLPDPPDLTAPASADKITGTHVHLAWSDAGPDVRYVLQVALDPAFGNPIERPALQGTQLDLEDLAPGHYYWRVAARNVRAETGRWSAAQSFTQRAAMPMPDAPQLIGRRADFHWQSIPGQGYRAQISRDPQFATIAFEQRLDQPSWSLPKLFPGTYYLRVQGIDSDGSDGTFSPPRRFSMPVPLWIKVAVPFAVAAAVIL